MHERRFVYILRSERDPERHYVGIASNPHDRLITHNAGASPHTSKYRPWRLIVTLEFSDPDRALKFERYLKTGSGRAFAKRHFG